MSKRTVYDRSYLMKSNGKSIKQKPTAELLGISLDCNLTWNEQINIITKSTHGVLRVLKTLSALCHLQHVNAWLNHLFYHELILQCCLRPNA